MSYGGGTTQYQVEGGGQGYIFHKLIGMELLR